jgi:hypothetical protein
MDATRARHGVKKILAWQTRDEAMLSQTPAIHLTPSQGFFTHWPNKSMLETPNRTLQYLILHFLSSSCKRWQPIGKIPHIPD